MSELHISAADLAAMDKRYRATFVNCLSGAKSACVVGSSQGRRQQENLAIVTSVVHIGADPPLLGMIMRPHTVRRDTLENIQQHGIYTLNQVATPWVEQAHHTAARYPADVSEFAQTGLTPWYADHFDAPGVAESPLRLAMQLRECIPIALNNTQLVIGQIQDVWVDEAAVNADGQVDLAALQIAAVSGLDTYHQLTPVGRFDYAKPKPPYE